MFHSKTKTILNIGNRGDDDNNDWIANNHQQFFTIVEASQPPVYLGHFNICYLNVNVFSQPKKQQQHSHKQHRPLFSNEHFICLFGN